MNDLSCLFFFIFERKCLLSDKLVLFKKSNSVQIQLSLHPQTIA